MLHTVMSATLLLLAAAAVLAFIRLVRGPTLPDRVVAMDLLGILIVGLIVVATAVTGEMVLLDVAMVIALVSFIGTVAYSRYLEGERRP
jgi:multicomponent Na+:H+ antiporter subunit F